MGAHLGSRGFWLSMQKGLQTLISIHMWFVLLSNPPLPLSLPHFLSFRDMHTRVRACMHTHVHTHSHTLARTSTYTHVEFYRFCTSYSVHQLHTARAHQLDGNYASNLVPPVCLGEHPVTLHAGARDKSTSLTPN